LEPDDIAFRADARLWKMVDDANREFLKTIRKQLPKYQYPKNVIMSPTLSAYSRCGITFVVKKSECYPIEELDAQREVGKAIYGKGYLISDRVVERRDAAEEIRAQWNREKAEPTTVWPLSDREKEIIEQLNQNAE
jgi:hypothetical protein